MSQFLIAMQKYHKIFQPPNFPTIILAKYAKYFQNSPFYKKQEEYHRSNDYKYKREAFRPSHTIYVYDRATSKRAQSKAIQR